MASQKELNMEALREIAAGTYPMPEHGWTCFHCGETFTTPGAAREHFGPTPESEPGCCIKVRLGGERGLLGALRNAEAQLAKYMAEDSDSHRTMIAMQIRHSDALMAAEEAGYARGLRDGIAMSPEEKAKISPVAPLYIATLRTRKDLEAERNEKGYTDAWGWWADICPGATLQLRDATSADLARCSLRENCSRDPSDWLCEPKATGSLIARSAIATLLPEKFERNGSE